MTRTRILTIGLAVMLGSVCTGQEQYTQTALPRIEIAGLSSVGSFGGFAMTPGNVDDSSLLGTLEGVKGTLSVFEQSDGASGLPLNICPFWVNLPDVAQIQLGMGLSQQPQTIGSINVTQGAPNTTGQIGAMTLPITGFTGTSSSGIQTLNFADFAAGW